MNNAMDTLSPGGAQLSDEALMNLLIKVRSGELSPEEAEALLSSRPGLKPATGLDPQGGRAQSPEPGAPLRQLGGHEASAALAGAKSGTLIVDALAASFTIRGADLATDLFQARYNRSFPSVWVEGNTVTARFNYFSLGALREWLNQGGDPRAEFSLNSAVPWNLELRSHMSHLDVNLRGLPLAALYGDGNMNHLLLTLDKPVGRIPIHYNGNACSVEIRCPAQSRLRVEILGNTNAADVAGRKFASKSAWQTPGFDTAQDRYCIVLSGEASSFNVNYT